MFMALSARLLPWIAARSRRADRDRAVSCPVRRPARLPAGQTAKIMYVHVPSAWLAMFGYVVVAVSSFGLLVFRHPLADVSAKAAAPVGAVFTGLCLLTGMLWGKPMWGAFWVWDPRLTSVLILFLLYLGLIALRSSIEDESLAGKLTAVLALVGIAIIPVIKFSGRLEQPASAGQHHADRRAGHPHLAAVAAAGDDVAAWRCCFGFSPEGDAQRDPAAARQGTAHRQGRRRRVTGAAIARASAMDFGPHAGFIWASYAIAAVVLSLLAAWLVIDGRRLQRLLDELEAHGVRRRSDRG
jgi:heme exporter protein C